MSIIIDQAQQMMEGAGARVNRLFPISRARMNFDPFVLWDDFRIQPGSGFPTHPHRGFEAITYIFHGSISHKDNLGNESTVSDGGAQRFTAGRGLEHSEMPSRDGETRGIQLWINLPQRLKDIAPDYVQTDAGQMPVHALDQGSVKVIVGDDGAVKLQTPVRYLEVNLESGGRFQEQMPKEFRGLLYVVDGTIRINDQSLTTGGVVFFEAPASVDVSAEGKARFMVCFGRPHREPIRQWGPYVD
ncbi:MAG: pirin family protein [Gammaproteobacteria bacterium]|nr:pirin family protein [Gammaproteobacteria bacterium]